MSVKALFFIVITTFLGKPISSFGQTQTNDYEPKILILSPAKTFVDPSLQKELNAQNDTIVKQLLNVSDDHETITKKLEGEPENFVLMTSSISNYSKHLNFFKQTSLYSSSFLTYRFYERFPNVLILLNDTTVAPGVASMQKLAAEKKMPYIISFPEIRLIVENGKKLAKVKVQLYEHSSNSFLIDQEYTGNDSNPGFEFTCNEGTINCTINNALSGALTDIVKQIAANNSTLINQHKLTNERVTWLRNNLLPAPYDNSFLRSIISIKDSSIDLNNLYQCLYNSDKTQFVAFFIKGGVNSTFKKLQDKADKSVNIITDKDINDPSYLDEIPQTYAYIVKGVNYQGKWYYQKDHITYFNAPTLADAKLEYLSNLEGFGYFKENSTEPSTEFWNGSLFEKITDRKKDPNWEKYKDIWEMEERENRDYIGLYAMVADEFKEQKKIEDENYQIKISSEILEPFFEKQVKLHSNNIASFNTIQSNFIQIYPKDKHIILSPVKITDEKGIASIRYFLIIPSTAKIYEWNYNTPYILKNNEYPTEIIIKTLGVVTKWDFSYNTLDDNAFWDNDVLIKEGDNYKYLKLFN